MWGEYMYRPNWSSVVSAWACEFKDIKLIVRANTWHVPAVKWKRIKRVLLAVAQHRRPHSAFGWGWPNWSPAAAAAAAAAARTREDQCHQSAYNRRLHLRSLLNIKILYWCKWGSFDKIHSVHNITKAEDTGYMCTTYSEKFKMNQNGNTILSVRTCNLLLIWNIFCLLEWDSHFH